MRAAAVEFSPGGQLPDMAAGDIILVHGTHLISRLVQLAQRIVPRFWGTPYHRWSHAVWVGHLGLVEALGNGVVRSPFAKYRDVDFHLIRTGTDPRDAAQMEAFADSVLRARARYSYVGAASLFFTVPFGYALAGVTTMFCSGLTCEIEVRGPVIYDRAPACMFPADLAAHYGVTTFRGLSRAAA